MFSDHKNITTDYICLSEYKSKNGYLNISEVCDYLGRVHFSMVLNIEDQIPIVFSSINELTAHLLNLSLISTNQSNAILILEDIEDVMQFFECKEWQGDSYIKNNFISLS